MDSIGDNDPFTAKLSFEVRQHLKRVWVLRGLVESNPSFLPGTQGPSVSVALSYSFRRDREKECQTASCGDWVVLRGHFGSGMGSTSLPGLPGVEMW